VREQLEQELQLESPGVYPPSFCAGRMVLTVMLITELAVLLVGIGKDDLLSWAWLGLASLYAQWLAVFCVAGLCVNSTWINRMSPTRAWTGNWLVVVVLAVAFSFAAWQVAPWPKLGGIKPSVHAFVLESTFAVAIVAAAFLRYLLVRSRWRAELIAQADARVQALQARIRPHFLFNSLNTIASLIPVDPRNAESAIEDLADIFRGSMRRADEAISLADELSLARQYLDMEKRRLGERLQIDWRVSELPPKAAILPLMLQPLLENAVGHGVALNPEGGTVSVYGRSEGDQVVITISNPMVNHVAPKNSGARGHGMALPNIRDRLRLAYGARASLVTYHNDQQFYVVLSLPYVAHTDR
jgi:two-component system sensor histidine kinase AlgZ